MNPQARVVAYCWEVNSDHPRLEGKQYGGGGDRLKVGDRGPWWPGTPPAAFPWGLTQVWRLANGQEVKAKWKAHAIFFGDNKGS